MLVGFNLKDHNYSRSETLRDCPIRTILSDTLQGPCILEWTLSFQTPQWTLSMVSVHPPHTSLAWEAHVIYC